MTQAATVMIYSKRLGQTYFSIFRQTYQRNTDLAGWPTQRDVYKLNGKRVSRAAWFTAKRAIPAATYREGDAP